MCVWGGGGVATCSPDDLESCETCVTVNENVFYFLVSVKVAESHFIMTFINHITGGGGGGGWGVCPCRWLSGGWGNLCEKIKARRGGGTPQSLRSGKGNKHTTWSGPSFCSSTPSCCISSSRTEPGELLSSHVSVWDSGGTRRSL